MTETDDGAAEAEERARQLFAAPCRFVAAAADVERIPELALPEVAFAGRSNVGKSSLINALTGHKTLARISRTPGRTQQLNFFNLGGRLILADLPGYGYAKVSKRRVEQWTRLADAYLRGRDRLRRVLLLIDARHGIKDSDRRVMSMLDRAAVSYQAILTKCDKLSGSGLAAVMAAVGDELARHAAAHPEVLATSARSGIGIPALQAALAALAAPEGADLAVETTIGPL